VCGFASFFAFLSNKTVVWIIWCPRAAATVGNYLKSMNAWAHNRIKRFGFNNILGPISSPEKTWG